MNLSRKIAAAVEELGRTGVTTMPVTVVEGPHRLTLALDLATPVAVACSSLELESAALDRPERSLDTLKSWADRLVARATYLLEPLAIHEVDPVANVVLLRSKAPSCRDGVRAFYELRMDGRGTVRLARYRYNEAGRRRHVVPCQLTIETLERLADDLVASVA